MKQEKTKTEGASRPPPFFPPLPHTSPRSPLFLPPSQFFKRGNFRVLHFVPLRLPPSWFFSEASPSLTPSLFKLFHFPLLR